MTVTRKIRTGFTLMELMISMAVGSIVLLVAASLLGGTGDTYNQVGGGVAAEREARALISQLSADLAAARFHEDGVFENSGSGWAGDRLGFLSLQPGVAQSKSGRIGDLCAVHYYLEDLEVGGKTMRCLMRGFRESEEVFAGLKSGSVAGLFEKRLNVDEPVAFGVLSFEARPEERTEDGKWQDWVENEAEGPESVALKLVVARPELVAKLETAGDWDGGGAMARLMGEPEEAERNKRLEVYQTRIRFGHHAD